MIRKRVNKWDRKEESKGRVKGGKAEEREGGKDGKRDVQIQFDILVRGIRYIKHTNKKLTT